MTADIVNLDGQFRSIREVRLSVYNRGFLYGHGIFETMRAYNGKIFQLAAHIERLYEGADFLGLAIKKDLDKHIADTHMLLRLNMLKSAYVRISAAMGPGGEGPWTDEEIRPTVVTVARPLNPYPQSYYIDGVKIRECSFRRNPGSPLPRIKSLNYLENILALKEVRSIGYHEALMLNTNNKVCECATSNIFGVKDGKIFTPCLEDNLLPGITRKTVMELSKEKAIPIEERSIELSELIDCDEVFITNSLMEILPVVQINDKKIGSGVPSIITKVLMEKYSEFVKEMTETI